jgi:hypothetical protein
VFHLGALRNRPGPRSPGGGRSPSAKRTGAGCGLARHASPRTRLSVTCPGSTTGEDRKEKSPADGSTGVDEIICDEHVAEPRCPTTALQIAQAACVSAYPFASSPCGVSADRLACGPIQAARRLPVLLFRQGRRSDFLRADLYRRASPCHQLCRSYSQGGKSRPTYHAAANPVPAGDQCQSCKGSRPRSPTDAARSRRRGDRVSNSVRDQRFASHDLQDGILGEADIASDEPIGEPFLVE